MSRRTFHQDGVTEVRATILTAGKRVDIHVFGDDAARALGLGHVIKIATRIEYGDGHKIEIDADNLRDFGSE